VKVLLRIERSLLWTSIITTVVMSYHLASGSWVWPFLLVVDLATFFSWMVMLSAREEYVVRLERDSYKEACRRYGIDVEIRDKY
jgi:hypothetical protein